ncbi:biotin--[acetyl-CoA-carboxylase] ligase (plasmid) [Cereibacter sphaeroides]|uniref:biotin--[acetyl-CoA-carboxylase] ligase n=1 Tax=Cereibacter sphaeroides TaxID=1063 RepID=UPI000F51C138|nr:biotin--[acetyl-CoA-carboxylase] ligase [Cereibacter sphaeroides]AZB57964.1 biotin--[acetyl-CoA-carboxylase] ligase [Cereibacter sphaeroides]
MSAHRQDLGRTGVSRLFWLERRTGVVGREIHYLPVVDSTNRFLADLARGQVATGTVVVAGHQTSGRGKNDRPWQSRPGTGLMLSVLLRPRRPAEALAQATLVIAVAVAEAVAEATGLEAAIKWPNDLMVEGRKLCGILCELVMTPEGEPAHVIAGIGLNVRQGRADFPEALGAIATSVAAETGRPIDRFGLLAALLDRLDRRLGEWERAGFGPARQAWSARSCTLGCEIVLQGPEGPCHGTAMALEADGSLTLRGADGTLQNFLFGETSPLPAGSGRAAQGSPQVKENERK